mmetsp:Transcript_40500/g.47402  ORF Transcript_40500/g.47402 Transcript_40500/m.47402 type:complete len:219 (+) Transcript_40500:176-832(+)
MILKRGDNAPNFALKDINGMYHKLHSHKGRKVMLCFNRFASCPLCRMDMDYIIHHQEILSRAGIDIICVFPSPSRVMEHYLPQKSSSLTLLTDPSELTYKMFGVGKSAFALCLSLMGVGWGKGISAYRRGYKSPPNTDIHGAVSRLPAEFLIDEQGRVVDAFRAGTIGQFMPWERIEAFMPSKYLMLKTFNITKKKKSYSSLCDRKRDDDTDYEDDIQ